MTQTVEAHVAAGEPLPDPRDLAGPQGGPKPAAKPKPAAAAPDLTQGTGLYWEPTEQTGIFSIFPTSDGTWEVAPNSLAEQVVTASLEHTDAYDACMRHLTTGEPYESNLELHRQFGSEDQYISSCEHAADDYALRVCVNDYWHMGDDVGNPQHRCDDPHPPGYVPMRDRIEAAYQAALQAIPAPPAPDRAAPSIEAGF